MPRSVAPLLCPLHRLPLLQSAKHGIEIDYCPRCYGAWFERGELDKVIEAYVDFSAVPPARPVDDDRHEAHDLPRRRRRRLRGKEIAEFLEDLFDFD